MKQALFLDLKVWNFETHRKHKTTDISDCLQVMCKFDVLLVKNHKIKLLIGSMSSRVLVLTKTSKTGILNLTNQSDS